MPADSNEDDEYAPLLSRTSTSGQNPIRPDRHLRFSFSPSLNVPKFLRRRSISFNDGDGHDEVDIDHLNLGLARVGSLPSGTGLVPGRPYAADSTRPRDIRKAPLAVNEVDDVPGLPEALLGHEQVIDDGAEDDSIDSKFIGIDPRRFWLVFVVVLLGYFIACFDSTLMASSHPVITSYFNASQAASWLSTVFLITSTAFQPLFGRLSDVIGRKPMFLLSFFIFGTTTLWCALANSIESFIAARAACGIGAGGTLSMASIIVSDLVRIEDRGVFQSHLNVAYGLGGASGAAFGGFLCDALGWRWSFGVQVPVIGLCFVMAVLFTPTDLGPMLINHDGGSAWIALRNFDSIGSVLLITTVTSLILALNLGGDFFPWTSPIIITFFVVFGVAAGLFLLNESRAKQPLVPLPLLSKFPLANLMFSNFLGGIATNTVLFNVPLFFQAVLLTSAASSGFRLAAPSIVGSMAGISTGYIITYTRRLKPTLVLGAAIYLIGSVAICFMNKHVSEPLSLVLITGVNLGQGFLFPNIVMSALAISPQAELAVVSTTIGLWRNLGTVIGVALSSLVFQNRLDVNLDSMVTGPDKALVVHAVKSSVKAIRGIQQPQRDQVIDAYELSLRTTFLCAVIASVFIVVLVVPVRLPRLRKGRKIVIGTAE